MTRRSEGEDPGRAIRRWARRPGPLERNGAGQPGNRHHLTGRWQDQDRPDSRANYPATARLRSLRATEGSEGSPHGSGSL